MMAGGGDDTVHGGEGNDLVFADGGVAQAWDGHDRVWGGQGDDTVVGGGGNDHIDGGEGNDLLLGDIHDQDEAGGNDTLYGGLGNDRLYGHAGDDLLMGGAGDDLLFGGTGNDTLHANSGQDLLDGGDGDDVLVVSAGASAVLRGGAGLDVYDIENLGPHSAIRIDDDDTQSQIRIRGDAGSLQAYTASQLGASAMAGGTVLLVAGSGGGILLTSSSAAGMRITLVDEHLAETTVTVAALLQRTRDAFDASDVATAQALADAPALQTEIAAPTPSARVSQFYVSSGDDYYEIPVDARGPIDAMGGNDWVVGTEGNDTVDGGGGDDRLIGHAGDDTLRGGVGKNALEGGQGNDVLVVSGSQDELLFKLGDGQDVVAAGWSSAGERDSAEVRIRLQGVSSPDALGLTLGPDNSGSVFLTYGDQGDRIELRTWNTSNARWAKTLLVFDDGPAISLLDLAASRTGSDQNDVIHAPAFALDLRGGAGDDVFHACSTDNVFEGGTGNDVLNGTATYRFADGWGHDVLRPGYSGTTTLDFSDALASTDVVFSRFVEEMEGSGWQPTLQMMRVESLKDGSSVVMPAYGAYRFVFSDKALDVVRGAGVAYDGSDTLRQDHNHVRNDDFSVRAADGSHRVLDGQGGDDTMDSRRWRRVDNSLYLNEDGWWFDEDAYWLKGGDGNDTLYGTTGDILDGGRGNDRLVQHWRTGEEATIRLALGDGQDTWTSNYHFDSLDHSVFAFAADVDLGSVWAEWVRTASTVNAAHDLVLHYGDQGDRVTLVGMEFIDQRDRETTARLRFADGTETLLHTTIAPAGITPETAGDDVILGTLGRDVIVSGEGNDRIVLDDGDTYVYRLGHGHDVIDTSRGSIQLADITDASRVKVERTSEGTLADTVNTWRITFADREETLQVRFKGVEHVPQLLLGDGKPFPLRALPRVGTEGYDSLTGGSGHDDLYGLGGDDGLTGGAGNDVLVGGRGNDTLRGGEGDDVYVYERGDGTDWVDADDPVSSVDTLRFGAGILESDVSLVRQGYDLEVRVRGDGGSVWIREHFNYRYSADTRDSKLDRIEFATGAVWDLPAIDALINTSATNQRPVFKGAIPLLKAQAGSTFSYTVPANTIVDPNPWDAVNYYAKMPDGSALPAWMSFDALTRTLTATPQAAQVGTLQFVLWGKDAFGYGTGQYVTLQVGAPAQPAAASAPEALAAAWPQAPAPTVADLGGAADVAPASDASTRESVAAALPQKESLAAALPQEASAVPSATSTAAPSARILGPVDFEARNAALWRDFGDTVGLSAYHIQRQADERAREAARWVTPAPLAAASSGSALERQAQINTQVDLMIQAMAAFGAPPPMGLGSYRAPHPQPGALFPPIAIGPN